MTAGFTFSLAPENKAKETYIVNSLVTGFIRPSSSPAGRGFCFVEIKDKTLRPCIDHQGLNDITVKKRFPLPLISSAFKPLQGVTVFSKLDLRKVYHNGADMKGGHYKYLVMPFGLANAPALFQALVNDVLRDMLNRFVFVYIDDILSRSPQEHVLHVRQVLQHLLEN
jgi:hypothetical protein